MQIQGSFRLRLVGMGLQYNFVTQLTIGARTRSRLTWLLIV